MGILSSIVPGFSEFSIADRTAQMEQAANASLAHAHAGSVLVLAAKTSNQPTLLTVCSQLLYVWTGCARSCLQIFSGVNIDRSLQDRYARGGTQKSFIRGSRGSAPKSRFSRSSTPSLAFCAPDVLTFFALKTRKAVNRIACVADGIRGEWDERAGREKLHSSPISSRFHLS